MPTAAELDAELLSAEFLQDPQATYHKLRAHDPVHWSEAWGAWVLTRYDDINRALRDASRFSSFPRYIRYVNQIPAESHGELSEFIDYWSTSGLNEADPPDHTRVRRLVSRAFTSKRVEAMRVHTEELANELLDNTIERGELDLIGDFAALLPATIIAEMMGLPVEDRVWFKQRTHEYVAFISTGAPDLATLKNSQRALIELKAWLADLIEERRQRPRDDLISALVSAQDRGDVVNDRELFAICVDLTSGGDETNTNTIGTGMLALLLNPGQLELLLSDMALLPGAVEEMVRYDPPFPMLYRVAKEDIELGGKTIAKGDSVRMILSAANRDPDVFPDPDRFDITRNPNAHISFAVGAHTCTGSNLARMELRIAFETLLKRLRGVRLTTPSDTFDWDPSVGPRGLRSLHLSFEPGERVFAISAG